MNTIILNKSKIHEGNLILVNADYPLQEENTDELVPAGMDHPNMLLRRSAANVLQTVLEKTSAGKKIVPVSGYRSMAEQQQIYNDSLKENGAEFTKKFVALPGHSEHQTGLAIDLGLYSDHIDFICPDFPYNGICEVFRKAAPGYGFVERYPAEKETVTGIAHEPWHFRYVGFPHSEIMTDKKLTLEEYSDFIKKYTAEQPLIYRGIGIYYVPVHGDAAGICFPEGPIYQISGNNIDGFVVTIWRKGQ